MRDYMRVYHERLYYESILNNMTESTMIVSAIRVSFGCYRVSFRGVP